jgi:hypothetical protein
MHIEAIDGERSPRDAHAQPTHPIKVDQEREEDLVARRTVLEDSQEVDFDRDSRDVSGVEAEGGRRGLEGGDGGGKELLLVR